jgi:tetratricopeptide (TPR) repeat protein
MRIKSRFIVASCLLASLTSSASAAPEKAKSVTTKQESSSAAAQTTSIEASAKAPSKDVKGRPLAQKIPKHFQEALVFQSMGVIEQAIAAYKLALKDDPTFVSTYNNLAQCYIDRGGRSDRDEAKKLVDEALKLSPDNLGTLHASALIADHDKQYEVAEKAYKRILEVQPLNFRAIQNLSELYYYKLGKPAKAKELLKATLKQNPPDQEKKVFVEALRNLDDLVKKNKSKKKVATAQATSK